MFYKSATIILALMTSIAAAHSAPIFRTYGSVVNLASQGGPEQLIYPSSLHHAAVIGIAIRKSDDHVHVFYANGTYSVGSSLHFASRAAPVPFELPDDYLPDDIVGMAFNRDDNLVTWFKDKRYSMGSPDDLNGYFNTLPSYSVTSGQEAENIVGIAMVDSGISPYTVYTWFADGTLSKGTAKDLDKFAAPGQGTYDVDAVNIDRGDVIAMGISSKNKAYAWFREVADGPSTTPLEDTVDNLVTGFMRRFNVPGASVAVSKDGRMVHAKGYGKRDITMDSPMDANSRIRIGSTTKVITALGAIHLGESNANFQINAPIYTQFPQGLGGPYNTGPYAPLLPDYIYGYQFGFGASNFHPVIAKAIGPEDAVYTWYSDGTFAVGTSTNPTKHYPPIEFSHREDQSLYEIRGIAMTPSGYTYTLYDDGVYAIGYPWDLDALVGHEEEPEEADLPLGAYRIVGIGATSAEECVNEPGIPFYCYPQKIYVWFDNRQRSAGSIDELDNQEPLQFYSALSGSGTTHLDIRAMAISKKTSKVYSWYGYDSRYVGTSTNLDLYTPAGDDYQEPSDKVTALNDRINWYKQIRLKHLLSHTSGFFEGGHVDAAMDMMGVADEQQINYGQVNQYQLRRRPLAFKPGTDKKYANHGMGLVGHLIAENSGQSFVSYIEENIIHGLNMRTLTPAFNPDIDSRRHVPNDAGYPVPEALLEYASEVKLPAGGLWSSAGDLVRLMLRTDGNPNHADVISAASKEIMEKRYYDGISNYALGWKSSNYDATAEQAEYLHHNGAVAGSRSYAVKFRQDWFDSSGDYTDYITVALLFNISSDDLETDDMENLAKRIANHTDQSIISPQVDFYSNVVTGWTVNGDALFTPETSTVVPWN